MKLSTALCSSLLMLLVPRLTAVLINDTQVPMDEAIEAAALEAGGNLDEMMPDEDTVLVELDILYEIDTYLEISKDLRQISENRKKRKAIIPISYRWENGRVPYEITDDFSARDKRLIQNAIDEYSRYTCIRFVPATQSDRNRVRFQTGTGCSSFVGKIRRRRVQEIRLAGGCRYHGIIVHEMGHAIGFQHEQTRPDRDNYVRIVESNIQDGKAFNFRRYTTDQVDNHGIPYDYLSVMHYGQRAFSKNGDPTIYALDSRFQNQMGNREGLSYSDIMLANKMYQCASLNSCQPRRCPDGAFQGQDCKCWCNSGDREDPLEECDGAPIARTTTTTTSTVAPPPPCNDNHRSCAYWASVGYCQGVYEGYMTKNCRLSCDNC